MACYENFAWENLFIFKAANQDIDFICKVESDPENKLYISKWTTEQHLEHMQESSMLYLIVQTNKGNRMGFVILDNLGSNHNNIEFKRMIITEKGKGYGRTLVKAIKWLAFNKLGCHRLWMDVLDFNSKAKNLYISEGFKEEGAWRECWLSEGRYHSLVFLSMLEQEYESSNIK